MPVAHVGQVPPPQSTSLSVPFLTESVHVAALQWPPVHTPLWQSLATKHCLPAAQVGHVPPPQSTSLSVPFLTASVQVAALQ